MTYPPGGSSGCPPTPFPDFEPNPPGGGIVGGCGAQGSGARIICGFCRGQKANSLHFPPLSTHQSHQKQVSHGIRTHVVPFCNTCGGLGVILGPNLVPMWVYGTQMWVSAGRVWVWVKTLGPTPPPGGGGVVPGWAPTPTHPLDPPGVGKR